MENLLEVVKLIWPVLAILFIGAVILIWTRDKKEKK